MLVTCTLPAACSVCITAHAAHVLTQLCCRAQAYITNLNVALEKQAAAEAKGDVAGLIGLQGAIKFNGGGHVNHTIFWTNLAPASKGGGGEPEGDLAAYITKSFGSFEVCVHACA